MQAEIVTLRAKCATGQQENNSRSPPVRPVNDVRARMLHPFTTMIIEEQMSYRMLPALEKYDGSEDPEEHLRSFADAMAIYSSSELVWCRVCSLSIKGNTLTWFYSLCLETIDSFGTLRNLFEQQFASSKVQNLTYMELTKSNKKKMKA